MTQNFILSNVESTHAVLVHSPGNSWRRSRPSDQEHKYLKGGNNVERKDSHSRFERKQLETSFTSEFYHRLPLNSGGKMSEVCCQMGREGSIM